MRMNFPYKMKKFIGFTDNAMFFDFSYWSTQQIEIRPYMDLNFFTYISSLDLQIESLLILRF